MFPDSWNVSDRASLQGQIKPVHSLALSHFHLPDSVNAYTGAQRLSEAVNDSTRSMRPNQWNGLCLWTSSPSLESFAGTMTKAAKSCSFAAVKEVANLAVATQTFHQDKMQPMPAEAQSVEWSALTSPLSISMLSDAFHDASMKLVNNEGRQSYSTIGQAVSTLEQKKAQRDTRLNQTRYQDKPHGLNTAYFTAISSAQLANNIQGLGSDDMHWFFWLFVGSDAALKPIKQWSGA